ncbi:MULTISPECIES: SemiSWEET transporter [unclassified Chelatococcus]|uniref:SemiSWEET family sugar transporter n=1 Tax=unclassified Chelatococcus TaxID=2638111 RepID=UPI001BCA92D1|nr:MULTISPECIES: SemiSWEET transporter [unclassified Chelatococcus]MBS7697798.1 SemiSWEET transporter [Chelatococcus sp. YT9]MBX3559737.1 SemiSWEET transporter [Chelatococcus sp.]
MPTALLIESLGALAAALTTLCWLPQAIRIVRTRDTRALSLFTQVAFASGVFLWLVYGLLVGSWPLIAANLVTLLLMLIIISMKLRFG